MSGLRVLAFGMGFTLQDKGRRCLAKYGVPASGAMDSFARYWANALLGNDVSAPVIECLMSGAEFEVLEKNWFCFCGATSFRKMPAWRPVELDQGETISLSYPDSGVWSYIAVAGGWQTERVLGSASAYGGGFLGKVWQKGDLIEANPAAFRFSDQVSGKYLSAAKIPIYKEQNTLRIWPGPQWDCLVPCEHKQIFSETWKITAQCDRVGYRLQGNPLMSDVKELISEPMLPGTMQLPANGQPIITMRDGPTVGGYPKIAVLEEEDIARLAQMQPGQSVRFEPMRK